MRVLQVYVGADEGAKPIVKRLSLADIRTALVGGFEDFFSMPTHLAFLGAVYPIAGVIIAYFASRADLVQLVFPLASGLALIGPIVATGLYEMSRKRERGLATRWADAFDVLRSPSLPAIGALSLLLLAIFFAWIGAAQLIYKAFYGAAKQASFMSFFSDVVSSERGLWMFVVGGFVGFVFAALAYAVSVIAFPLLLDRDVGLVGALRTSFSVIRANPLVMAAWALTIAVLIVLGSLPLFVGLAVVMPVMGHASWRFYRLAVERDPAHEIPAEWPPWRVGRPASQISRPHAVLFPWPPKDR